MVLLLQVPEHINFELLEEHSQLILVQLLFLLVEHVVVNLIIQVEGFRFTLPRELVLSLGFRWVQKSNEVGFMLDAVGFPIHVEVPD